MFNLKGIFAALRFCVLGVLLLVPLTSYALPANDNHAALRDAPAFDMWTGSDEDLQTGRRLCGAAWTPQHYDECRRSSDAAREDCDDSCTFLCETCAWAHMGCMFTCLMTGP